VLYFRTLGFARGRRVIGVPTSISKEMKTYILAVLVLLSQICGADDIDFLTIIKNSPENSKALGLQKLNPAEQAALNDLLNRAYRLGAERQAPQNNQAPARPIQPGAVRVAAQPVYITKIDEDKNDVLKLANGAVVEISRGFLGFVGFRKDAVLYNDGGSWKIWIEGKKVFSCDVLKAPENRPSGAAESISISEVKGNGKILTSLDGSLYEVSDLNTIDTALWIGPFEALLIDGSKLLNLEDGDEVIEVTKMR
jgi:hypothetical protein